MTSKIPDLEESIKTLLTNIPKFRYAGIGDNTTSACVTQPFRAFGLRLDSLSFNLKNMDFEYTKVHYYKYRRSYDWPKAYAGYIFFVDKDYIIPDWVQLTSTPEIDEIVNRIVNGNKLTFRSLIL